MLDVSVTDTCTHIFDKITHAASLNKLSQAYLSKVAIQLTDICNSPHLAVLSPLWQGVLELFECSNIKLTSHE